MINMIVACDDYRVIGNSKTNKMPWHIKEDLTYFKEVTMGHTVIMGKNTFNSIGKKLEGRENIIITSDKDFIAPNCIVCHSTQDALSKATHKEIFIIGGGSIYMQFIDLAQRLYITEVNGVYTGDIVFPKYEHLFNKSFESCLKSNHDGTTFKFTIWDRK